MYPNRKRKNIDSRRNIKFSQKLRFKEWKNKLSKKNICTYA